jgi:hypothetical protein
MHQQGLGRCGVHFVGLNPKRTPWTFDGDGAHEVIRERWDSFAGELDRLVWGSHFSNPSVFRRDRTPEPVMG